jgi:hypothetical protein
MIFAWFAGGLSLGLVAGLEPCASAGAAGGEVNGS